MPSFCKPALSSRDLVGIMQKRGLCVPDVAKAERYINNIGYYRLSAYFLPFYKQKDCFKAGITFNDILELYIFDRKLRLLALDAVQRIEISVRAIISNYMSLRYDPFWMLNAKLFRSLPDYQKFKSLALNKAGKHSPKLSVACKHYFTQYGDHDLPPSWVTIEELSMGTWSKIFSNLKYSRDKNAIAQSFNIRALDFGGWLKSITLIRNGLAHHNRFWNAIFPFRPAGLKIYAQNCGQIAGSYENFIIIQTMFKNTMHSSSWPQRLYNYLEDSSPFDYHACMKFPVGWEILPFWQ